MDEERTDFVAIQPWDRVDASLAAAATGQFAPFKEISDEMEIESTVIRLTDMNQQRSTSTSRARVSVLIWIVMLVVGVGYVVLINDMGDMYCETVEGSSDFGTFAWSVLSPGPTCMFSEAVHGFDEVRGPTPVMSIWMLALVFGAVWCVESLRRSRR